MSDDRPDGILPHKETTTTPDPSRLTVDMLVRELKGLQAMLEARMNGTDKRIELMQEVLDKRGDAIRQEVEHLRDLHQERFKRVETQILERDTRTEQTSRDSKVAVDAAFAASKEAVSEQNKSTALSIAKSEAAFTKQLDGLLLTMTTLTKSLDDKINDLKSRIDMLDARNQGGGAVWAIIIAVAGVLIGFGALAINLFKSG